MNKARFRRRLLKLERYALRAEKLGAFFVIGNDMRRGCRYMGLTQVRGAMHDIDQDRWWRQYAKNASTQPAQWTRTQAPYWEQRPEAG